MKHTMIDPADLITRLLLALFLVAVVAMCAVAAGDSTSVEATPVQTEQPEQSQQTQTIELVSLSQTVEVLPTDDPVPSAQLPTDDAAEEPTEPAAATTETVEEAEEPTEETATEETVEEAPRTYNGITEGDVITGSLSYYDVCYKCCGSLTGVTASGLVITNGMEDPHVASCNWLPLGSVISIGGVEYTVADRGGSGLNTVGRVDIFVPEGHQAALQLGRTYGVEITIVSLAETE